MLFRAPNLNYQSKTELHKCKEQKKRGFWLHMATASVHTPQGAKNYVFVAELGEIWDRSEHFSGL